MNILISDIECTSNRSTDNESIRELAENIGALGLLNPITLKKLPEDASHRYTVVAGRRRFQALKLLEKNCLNDAEYRIVDADADMVAFSENFHRSQLTIREELAQLQALEKKYGTANVAFLAKELGKTERWVRTRIRLLNLSPKWQRQLDKGDIPISYLEEVAKYPADVQEDQLQEYIVMHCSSAKEAARKIAGELTVRLPKKHWPECDTCPKNPATDTFFFADCPASCTDRTCLREKVAADLGKLLDQFRQSATMCYICPSTISWRDREWYEKKFKFQSIHGYNEDKKGHHTIIVLKDAGFSVVRGDVYSCYTQYALFAPAKNDGGKDAPANKIDPNVKIKGKQTAVALTELMKFLDLDYAADEIRNRITAAGDPQLYMRMLIFKYGYRMPVHNSTDIADYRQYAQDEHVFTMTVLKNIIPEIHERLRCIHRDHSQTDLIKCLPQIEMFARDLKIDFKSEYLSPAETRYPLKNN